MCHHQEQMEEGVRANRIGAPCAVIVSQRRWSAQAFRVVVAAACLAAAAVLIGRQSTRGGDVNLDEYAADTKDNIFSHHYESEAEQHYLAAHPPAQPRQEILPPSLPSVQRSRRKQELPAMIGYSRKEARSFLSEIPGMGQGEMEELVKAASVGHQPLVQPVAPKPRPLSAETIAQEHIRAEDVFSSHYGRPVRTEGQGRGIARPDSELRSTNGEAAAVMRQAGMAFAMAEQKGGSMPEFQQTVRHESRQATAKMDVQQYMPADKTSQLAAAQIRHQKVRQEALSAVPAVDRDLISGLDQEENQIDDMHIMSKAQRAILNPESTEDIDSELLKKSINSLNSINPGSERTGIGYSEHRESRQHFGLNGDEGSADTANQMQALKVAGQHKEESSTDAYSKILNAGSKWNQEMKAAVKASEPSDDADIPIGDADTGDDSGASIFKAEQKEIHAESIEDKDLLKDASSMWPSAAISRHEEER